jgi:hypothetical protein
MDVRVQFVRIAVGWNWLRIRIVSYSGCWIFGVSSLPASKATGAWSWSLTYTQCRG